MSFDVIPMISIHPDKICYYKQIVGNRPHRASPPRHFLVPGGQTHSDTLSRNASRKLKKSLSYLLAVSKFKQVHFESSRPSFKYRIGFLTLTLPSKQTHPDKVIMRECFNAFLTVAKKKWDITHYIWKAEKQENGNIHFHILVNRFVPWSELRDTWNNIIEKLGYVSSYRSEMKSFHSLGVRVRHELLKQWSYKKQIAAYHEGVAKDWRSPNSTDVHALKDVRNIHAYILKYMLKSYQNVGVTSRLWGCSYSLSRAKGAVMVVDSYVATAIQLVRKIYEPFEFFSEHFSVIFIDAYKLARDGLSALFNPWSEYLQTEFAYI
jgi:hypothetical protein